MHHASHRVDPPLSAEERLTARACATEAVEVREKCEERTNFKTGKKKTDTAGQHGPRALDKKVGDIQ